MPVLLVILPFFLNSYSLRIVPRGAIFRWNLLMRWVYGLVWLQCDSSRNFMSLSPLIMNYPGPDFSSILYSDPTLCNSTSVNCICTWVDGEWIWETVWNGFKSAMLKPSALWCFNLKISCSIPHNASQIPHMAVMLATTPFMVSLLKKVNNSK